ncbi:MAG: hypothetical protein ACI9X0_002502 [Kiritimatiellia bacterium]|jgi:hypothetical protein
MYVLEQLSGSDFRPIGKAPDWCTEIYPESSFDTPVISPAERFPFLEYFLTGAEAFWQNSGEGVFRSPNWIETGPDGEERYLDALAFNVGSSHMLIINLLGIGTTERQTLLQKSRETEVALQRDVAEARRCAEDLKRAAGGAVPSVTDKTLTGLRDLFDGDLADSDILAFANAIAVRLCKSADTLNPDDSDALAASIGDAVRVNTEAHQALGNQLRDDTAKSAAFGQLLFQS